MATTKSNKAETKSISSLFSIHVRPDLKAQKAKQGAVKDNMIVGESRDVIAPLPEQLVENGYEAWVIRDKDWKNNGLFSWAQSISDNGAEKIEIRFLENSKSLDAMYQEKIGLKPQTEEEKLGWFYPSNYRIDFSRKTTSPLWIEFMEHHELCGTNKLRIGNSTPAFIIVDAEQNVKRKRQSIYADSAVVDYKKAILEDEEREYCLSIIHGISFEFAADDRKDMLLEKIDELTYDKFVLVEEQYLKNLEKEIGRIQKKSLLVFQDGAYTTPGIDRKFFDGFPLEQIEEKGKEFLFKKTLIDDFEDLKKELEK